MSLSAYLNGFSPAPAMPLMHSTSVGAGAQILVSGELRLRTCTVYGEDLVYLFYGRPAFKPLPGVAASGINEHLPMCFVIDPALLGAAIRVLPFDSGGYGRYSHCLGPTLNRPDFELGPGGEFPMRLVSAFYETNRNYFHQSPSVGPDEIPLTQCAARGFARLANDITLADDDDRRSTFEIQIPSAVPLATALKALVAPAVLMSDPEVSAVLAAMPNVTPIAYDEVRSSAAVDLPRPVV